MTIDISKVKVGDIVTARFEDEVDYVGLDGAYPYVSTTSGVEFMAEGNGHFVDLKFTTPKPPLPTTTGSVVMFGSIHYMLSEAGFWVGSFSGSGLGPTEVANYEYVVKYDAGVDNG